MTSVDQHQRVFDQAAERLQKARANGTVDHPVIAAHRYPQPLVYAYLSTAHDRLVLDRADGKDPRLRRIDDRRELVDPEHAEVRHGECRAGVLLRCEPAL